jgi:hypothetical protein
VRVAAQVLLGAVLLAAAALAQPARAVGATPPPAGVLSGADVVALPPGRDGETITLQGEAIGDVLRAGAGHSWVNLLSDGVAVGVWMPSRDAALVSTLGDFRHQGDTLQVTGVFNAACDQHGGDLDVHAEKVTVVAGGERTTRPVTPWKVVVAVAVAGTALTQAIVAARRRRQSRWG